MHAVVSGEHTVQKKPIAACVLSHNGCLGLVFFSFINILLPFSEIASEIPLHELAFHIVLLDKQE